MKRIYEKDCQKLLHEIHNEIYVNGTYKRNIAKTFYFANILKGYLEVLEDEQIIVILEDRKRLKEFIDMFFELDGVQSLEPKFKKTISKIDFNNNSNKVFFKFRNDGKDIFDELRGSNIRKITPICDLDNLPSYFFTELNDYSESALHRYLPTQRTTVIPPIYSLVNSETGCLNLKYKSINLQQDFYL